ncbi:MAG: prenyltransferase, partial [Symploca sp. SIO1C4]|nr:prenyltransferase [Symploca sp. SIO1C4]
LHWRTGDAYYLLGEQEPKPNPSWFKAVVEYLEALKTLTDVDFPELHLEILQDLLKTLLGLEKMTEAQEIQRRGLKLLQRLLDESNRSDTSKQELARKFAGFHQNQSLEGT